MSTAFDLTLDSARTRSNSLREGLETPGRPPTGRATTPATMWPWNSSFGDTLDSPLAREEGNSTPTPTPVPSPKSEDSPNIEEEEEAKVEDFVAPAVVVALESSIAAFKGDRPQFTVALRRFIQQPGGGGGGKEEGNSKTQPPDTIHNTVSRTCDSLYQASDIACDLLESGEVWKARKGSDRSAKGETPRRFYSLLPLLQSDLASSPLSAIQKAVGNLRAEAVGVLKTSRHLFSTQPPSDAENLKPILRVCRVVLRVRRREP